jgi:hypothetical protein
MFGTFFTKTYFVINGKQPVVKKSKNCLTELKTGFKNSFVVFYFKINKMICPFP